MKENKSSLHSFGSFFIQCITITYILAILTFWIHSSINPFIFPIAIVLSLYFNFTKTKNLFILCSLSLVFILLSTIVYDYSYDGQCYHLGTIKQLCEGWNPIYQYTTSLHPTLDIWINHYARGMEIVSACIASTFQNLESGKSINLFFLASTSFYILFFLNHYLPKSKPIVKLWLTTIIALNPIVINQLFTFYIDYTSYSSILLLIVLLYSINTQDIHVQRISSINICLLLFFIPNIKFNILFWVVLLMLIYTIYQIVKKKHIPSLIYIFFLCGILGTTIGAFNPYITNTLHFNNPFYPLMGSSSVDIMTNQLPKIYQNHSIFYNVFHSLISNPNNNLATTNTQIFEISLNNLKASGETDTHIGGFGIFFFESIILLILTFYTSRLPYKRTITFVLLSLIGCLFILPSGWWARYVAFFYLFPIILALHLFKYNQNKKSRFVQNIALILLSIDSIISVGAVGYYSVSNNIKTDSAIYALSRAKDEIKLSTNNINFLDKLEKSNITYKNSNLPSPKGECLYLQGPAIIIDFDKYNLTYKKKWGIKILAYEE